MPNVHWVIGDLSVNACAKNIASIATNLVEDATHAVGVSGDKRVNAFVTISVIAAIRELEPVLGAWVQNQL